jgi:hypothetical protein
MLETLAGRLKWERAEDGIRVELPAQLDGPNICKSIAKSLSLLLFVYLILSIEIWFPHGFHEALHRALINW